jgi:hypothetical protein
MTKFETEADWLACTDPTPMLEFLKGKASDRKLRLFACACDRCGRPFSHADTASMGIVGVERYADGYATADELRSLVSAWDFRGEEDNAWYRLSLPEPFQTTSAAQIARDVAASAGYSITTYNAYSAARDKMANVLASLLRCMFSPFRPVTVNPAWPTPEVIALAQSIYDDRAFDRLPNLADALERAGCTNTDILAHCRSEGPHVRGCWVLDLLLDKK